MDSPGLFDPKVSQEELAAEVIQAVTSMHPGPDVIVYVFKIGSRYTKEEFRVYTRLKMLLDEEVTKYMLVLFTRGDALRRANKTIEDVLATVPSHLAQVLQECGGRYVVFDNTVTDNTSQVTELLKVARRIKAENGGTSYMCPKYANVGGYMEEEVNRRLRDVEKNELKNMTYVQELEDIQEQAQLAAMKAKEELEKKNMERQRAMEKEARKLEKDIQELNARLREQRAREKQQRREAEAYRERLEKEQKKERARLKTQRLLQKEEAERKVRKLQQSVERRRLEEKAEHGRRQRALEMEIEALRQQVPESQEYACRILETNSEHVAHFVTKPLFCLFVCLFFFLYFGSVRWKGNMKQKVRGARVRDFREGCDFSLSIGFIEKHH